MTPEHYQEERKKRGSQQSVADALGVHRVTVARREGGVDPISREAWLAICSLPIPPEKTSGTTKKRAKKEAQ